MTNLVESTSGREATPTVTRCSVCRRLRAYSAEPGMMFEWIEAPVPAGYAVSDTYCPACKAVVMEGLR